MPYAGEDQAGTARDGNTRTDSPAGPSTASSAIAARRAIRSSAAIIVSPVSPDTLASPEGAAKHDASPADAGSPGDLATGDEAAADRASVGVGAAAGDGTAIDDAAAADDDFATMEFPLLVDIVVDDDFDTLVFPRLAEGAEPPPSTDPEAVPIPAPGTELVGEFRGSGLTQVTYLARTASGQVVQLSRLLWLVLSGVDGSRTLGEVAARVSVEFGRTVSAGNVEYLLDNKLIPLGLVAGGEEQGPASPGTQHAALLSLRLRATVIPEAGVQVVARLFGPLFLPPVVAVVLASLTAADVWLVRSGGLLAAFRDVLDQPLLLLVLVGLSVVSMVFHECGHATACRYGGARPGRIGMGLYVLWPAMFTNVTDSYRLGRGGRIRTDLGGVYFNAVFAVVLAGAYLKTGYLPLAAAVLLTQIELAQQLLPSLRLDGYFILTDLVGVPDLFREIRPVLRSLIPGQPADPRLGALRRTARIALTAWVAVIVPLLSGEFVLLLLGLPQLATTFARSITAQASGLTAQFGRGEVATGLASVLSLVLLAFPAIGMCYVMLQTLRMLTRAAVAATRKRPLLRIPVGAVALAAAAGLATYWGVLPLPSHHPAPAAQPAAGPSPSLSPVLAVIPAASSTSPPWPSAVLARHAGPPSADGTRAPARRHHRAHRPRRVTPAETPVSQPVYPVLPSPTPSPSAKPTKSAKPSQSAKPTKSPSPSKSPTASKSPSPSASASASATVTPSSGPS